MRNIVEAKNIAVPNLNIESFGICYKPDGWNTKEQYIKYFIPSLTFTISGSWFKKEYMKTIYMPILFENDAELKNILTHYNNLYFVLSFKHGYDSIHYSSVYHISHIVDIKKIIDNEQVETEHTYKEFEITFIIKIYDQYDIAISMVENNLYINSYNDSRIKIDLIDNLYYTNDNNDKDVIKFLQDNYLNIPLFSAYYIKNPQDNILFNSKSLDEIIKYIDKLDEENKKRNEKLDSMISKKTFKLVED